ncbi:TIR domain-containing protein [Geomonas sp. RF6]|uniref:toll/interleukin-1 receptor domain-containing protein n=1 Tax=Geomonas sp. RF6 TaxID=2897342 RepID=UPI001E5C8FEC|nr:toll/interleukin-1 receptor domain-containing protein [Geomonas sp. RF6]UFS68879.1 TIR domain-containing protein [Geomonas sp. RF6]
MGGIFISYRRGDSAGYAGRLADHLRDHFGCDRVFMDIDTIEIGEDFVEALNKAVSSCTVLIAVIGPAWLAMTDAAGRRRLEEPNDYTRLEISAALERKIRVVPVLVQDAVMPKEDDLPDGLKTLTRRQALRLNNESWDYDVNRLCEVLERDLGIAPSPLARRQRKPEPRRPHHDEGTRRGYLIAGTLLLAAIVTAVVLYSGQMGRKTQPEVATGPTSAAGGPTAEVSDKVPGTTPASQSKKEAKRPKSAAKGKEEPQPAPSGQSAAAKGSEPEKAATPAAAPAPAPAAPQPAEQKPSAGAPAANVAQAPPTPANPEQPTGSTKPAEKADEKTTTAMATPPAKAPEPAPAKPASPQLYTINTTQDRSTVILVGADGKEKEHISLDPDRVQKVYKASDGKWGVVVFKVRNEDKYGVIPIDLTHGKRQEPVTVPSLPEGVTFGSNEAVISFAAGKSQRISLP